MKVLVTGADGQLTRSLAERSNGSRGIDLVAVGRPRLNLEQPGSAAKAIAELEPDVVINAAAFTAVDAAEDERERAFRINADAAGEVAEAAARLGAPVIQLSTDYVFDGSQTAAYDERARTDPIGVYGASKLAGEEQVRAANPHHLIVRTAWVYSPFGRNFVRTMVNAAKQRDVLQVVADQRGSPTSALDLADGLLAVLDRWHSEPSVGEGETFHLAGAGETSWFGFAEAIMDECRNHGLPAAAVQPIATADWPTRARRPANSVLNSEKFARVFRFQMPAWRESLAVTIGRLAHRDRSQAAAP